MTPSSLRQVDQHLIDSDRSDGTLVNTRWVHDAVGNVLLGQLVVYGRSKAYKVTCAAPPSTARTQYSPARCGSTAPRCSDTQNGTQGVNPVKFQGCS